MTLVVILLILCCILHLSIIFIFFFKQKTAYEMRISDWSSYVCSSDLNGMAVEPVRKERDRPVCTDVLLLGHTSLALQDAGGFGEQPDADHEQHCADGDREAELAPGFAAGVEFRVGPVGVAAEDRKSTSLNSSH